VNRGEVTSPLLTVFFRFMVHIVILRRDHVLKLVRIVPIFTSLKLRTLTSKNWTRSYHVTIFSRVLAHVTASTRSASSLILAALVFTVEIARAPLDGRADFNSAGVLWTPIG